MLPIPKQTRTLNTQPRLFLYMYRAFLISQMDPLVHISGVFYIRIRKVYAPE